MPGKAPALEKGLKVLELLISANEPLTLSGIAEGVGYKVSEIQRMVECLLKEDYLVRTAAGAYHPGARAFKLADLPRESALISRAGGPLNRFTLRTSESVHLSFLAERMLHVVYDAEGRGTVKVSIKPGLYDATETVSGRLFLAFQGEAGEGYEAIRSAGHAAGEMACAPGVKVIAVPVALGADPCAAAIATPYLLRRTDAGEGLRTDLLREIECASAEITAAF
jgi:DNA-binding IclR family transcriptional regulator